MASTKSKLLVIIPARNEESTVYDVVASAKKIAGAVVVVDDHSVDHTVVRARSAGAMVLPLATSLGAWGAVQAGIRYAVNEGYAVAITMDADGQHYADSIPKMVAPVLSGVVDVAIGACPDRGSAARRFVWWVFRGLTGLQIEDLTSGFRAYNRKALQLLASKEATLLDYQDIGVLLLLRSGRMQIGEVRVPMALRMNGHSRVFSSWRAVLYYVLYTGALSLSKLREGPTPLPNTSAAEDV